MPIGLLLAALMQVDGFHTGTVCRVADCAGVPRLELNGRAVSGTAVMPSPRVKPGESRAALTDFATNGVWFSSDIWTMRPPQPKRQWWLGDGVYDFVLFDALMDALVAASPDGHVFPRIKLEPPDAWIEAHPEEMLVYPMICVRPGDPRRREAKPWSEAWRRLYRRMLADMVEHVERAPYAKRIIGYHLGAGNCGEWHVFPPPGTPIPEAAQDARDPLPDWEASVARRKFYRRWSEDVASALIDAASLVKELTHGEKVVGAFFGYYGNDHEDLMRVIRSGTVDFFAAPPCYGASRAPGHPGRSQMFYQASCRLHGCAYYEESDFRTFLSDPASSPSGMVQYPPLAESVGLLRRSIGKALAGGWENWWFLLGGNRTFAHPDLMATVRRGAELSASSLGNPWRPAEVAVFTSIGEWATSTAGGSWETFGKDAHLRLHTEVLPRCGVPYDSYELSDVADSRVPDYRVYLFPNAFTLTEREREAIKRVVRRPGKTAVWVYAPGYYRGEAGDAANVSDLTGLEVSERPGGPSDRYARVFSAREPVSERDGARSVFLPLPPTADELREVFRAAGAHVWTEGDDPIAAGRGFVTVHAASSGEKRIHLPGACDVTEVFGAAPPRTAANEIVETLKLGETRVYRLSRQPDVHAP